MDIRHKRDTRINIERFSGVCRFIIGRYALFVIACAYLVLILGGQFWKPTHNPIKSDSAGYYTHLPQVFIYEDFGFLRDDAFVRVYQDDNFYPPETWFLVEGDNGKTISKFPIGVAIMEAPFFLVAHTLACLSNFQASGYSLPYKFFFLLSNLTYSLFGLFLTRKMLLNWFSPFISGLGILIIGLCTNFLFYACIDSGMSHNYSYMLFAALILLTSKFYESEDRKFLIAIGLLVGLISIIRPTNAIAILIFTGWGIDSIRSFRDRIHLFLRNWKGLLLAALAGSMVLLLQFAYWKWSVGTWLFYSYGEESLHFTESQVLNGLFSFRKGWLIYSPVMVLALYGFLVTLKIKKFPARILAPLYFILHSFVVFSWWNWFYGGSFGSRPMIEITALLIVPLCASLTSLSQSQWKRIVLIVFLLLTCGLNLLQSYQYRAGIIHHSDMNIKAYLFAFARIRPYSDKEQAIFEGLLTKDKEEDFGPASDD